MAITKTREAPPAQWCPFPSMVNPHSDQADRESFSWMVEHGLLSDADTAACLRRQRSGELAARTNPEVDAEMLRLLADWYVWLFAFDDGYCEDRTQISTPGSMALTVSLLARALDAGLSVPGPAGPFATSLREVRDRIASIASGSQLVRWESTVRDYLSAQMWEASNREAGRFPSLDEYVAMRRHAGATYTCLALIDVTTRMEIPPREADGTAVKALMDITANLVSWDNDLYSHAKEKAGDHGRHNLVEVLAHHHRCSVERATVLAVKMRDQEMESFVDTCAEIELTASAHTKNFMRNLGLWLRGHVEWSCTSSRFEVLS